MKYLAYTTGTIFILLGAAILMNIFQMNQLPFHFQLMMGAVLLLYGLFRILVTFLRKPPKNEKE